MVVDKRCVDMIVDNALWIARFVLVYPVMRPQQVAYRYTFSIFAYPDVSVAVGL